MCGKKLIIIIHRTYLVVQAFRKKLSLTIAVNSIRSEHGDIISKQKNIVFSDNKYFENILWFNRQ